MARTPQPTVKTIAQATRKRFFNDHSMMRLIMAKRSKPQVPSSNEVSNARLENPCEPQTGYWSLEFSFDLASAVEHLGAEVGIMDCRLELNPFRGARRAGEGVLRHRAAKDFQGPEHRLLAPQRLGEFHDSFAQ